MKDFGTMDRSAKILAPANFFWGETVACADFPSCSDGACFLKVTSSFFPPEPYAYIVASFCPLLLRSSDFFMIWTLGQGVFKVGLLTAAILCCLTLCALGGREGVQVQVWPLVEH